MSEIVAYAVRIDGVPLVFVSHEDLDATWAQAAGYVDSYAGLRLPTSLPVATDLRDGDFDESTATIEIVDIDDSLAEIFGGSVYGAPRLLQTVEASEDPAPEFGAGDDGSVTLWGAHVGVEAIGPAGERHQYPCFPAHQTGWRHVGRNEADALHLAPTPVTDQPRVWAGRHLTVWRVVKTGSTWGALDSAKRVWFGSMTGQGTVAERVWSLRCHGPESWVGGNLGAGVSDLTYGCRPLLKLDDQAPHGYGMSARLERISLGDGSISVTYCELADEAISLLDTYTGSVSYEELVTLIQGHLADIETVMGTEYASVGSLNQVTYQTGSGTDGFHVRFDAELSGDPGDNSVTARLTYFMHRDLWMLLGYDVDQQPLTHPVESPDQFCLFEQAQGVNAQDYFYGYFFAANAKAMLWYIEPSDENQPGFDDEMVAACTNGQAPRRWPPLFTGGAGVFTGASLQEFDLGPGGTGDPWSDVFLFGSNSRPLPAAPDDPSSPYTISDSTGDVTHQGLALFEGPYRRADDKDGGNSKPDNFAFDIAKERREGRTVQIARIGWRVNSAGAVARASTDFCRVVIYEWLDPSLWGIDWPKLQGPWAGWLSPLPDGKPIAMRTLIAIEFAGEEVERIDLAMLRTLATTGTAGGWIDADSSADIYGLQQPNPTITPGDNDLSAAIPIDAEVAQLGLSVPAAMLAPAAQWADVVQSVGTKISRARAVYAGAFSARQLFREYLGQAGLAWSLDGGKFGIFDPTVWPSPEDATANVDPESYAGSIGDPAAVRAQQSIRELAPIDRFTYKATRDPTGSTYKYTLDARAQDPGATYRTQTTTHTISAAHLILMSRQEINERLRRIGEFWSRAHFGVTVDLHAYDAQDIWNGSGILFTDPWLVDPSGATYGVSLAAARVFARDFRAASETVRIRAIVQAADVRLYCGAAIADAYGFDGTDYYIDIQDDWLSVRTDGSVDASQFGRPSWADSTAPTNVDIEVWGFDDVTWTRGLVGKVASIVTTPGSGRLVLEDALTGGVWYRDQHHLVVVRAWADQDAPWILGLLAPVCEEDGTHNTGEEGVRFVDA